MLATYRFRTLTSELPGDVRVPSLVAASEAALRRRGYAVRSSTSTEFNGAVDAVRHNADDLESLQVRIDARSSGSTRIEIRSEPLGDQAESRAILDAILAELGR